MVSILQGRIITACRFMVATLATIALALPLSAQEPPTPGEKQEKPLLSGIAAYHQGNYKEALSQLGLALPNEFNNAVLHYYLGNTYLKTNQRDSAIREFRIAYALQPEKEAGKLAKKALQLLNVDNEGASAQTAQAPPKPKPLTKQELDRQQTLRHLEDQTSQAAVQRQKLNDQAASNAGLRGTDYIERYKQEMIRSSQYFRRGKLVTPGLTPEQLKQLAQMEALFKENSKQYRDRNLSTVEDIQKSGENLKALMNDTKSGTNPKLSPHGTNLYVRNYETPKTGAAPSISKSNTNSK